MRLLTLLVPAAIVGPALAHGNHMERSRHQPLVPPNANWMTRHMAEEHHIANFDDDSFFTLHDYDEDGHWEGEEIKRTYGLFDKSNSKVPEERKEKLVNDVLALMDTDGDRTISRDEFHRYMKTGKTLPDYGYGPGHHGDDEYEYEIHHFEEFHGPDAQLEDLTHPEDIEHFAMHERLEEEEERLEKMLRQSIVEENIPAKFRRST